MTKPATQATQTKTHEKTHGKRTRANAADDEAASNPDILCHQIGLCRNLAELQSLISRHNLLNVIGDERFSPRMQQAIEEALDTMTEVLQSPANNDATLFPVPQDLAVRGWKVEREGVLFKYVKGQLSTSQYVMREEVADAARKLQQREGKHKRQPSTTSPEAASGDDAAALIEATEREQRGRWAALCELHSRKRQTKKSRDRVARLSEEYDVTYVEVTNTFGGSVALDMRERVEAAGAPAAATSTTVTGGERRRQLDAACGDDCGHTQAEHDAFDAGLLAGERGDPAEDCPHTESGLRLAWLTGHDVGSGNRSATPAVGDEASSLETDVRQDCPECKAAQSVIIDPEHPNSGTCELCLATVCTAPLAKDEGDSGGDTPAIEDAAAEPSVFKRVVEIKLNDHDIAELAREAASLRRQIAQLETEKSETDKVYKKKIGGLEEQLSKLLSTIYVGREEGETDCFERFVYETRTVELRRWPSCELISSRPMKERELQQMLPSI